MYFALSPDVWAVKAVICVLHLEYHPLLNGAAIGIPAVRFIRNYGLDMLWGYALASAIRLTVCRGYAEFSDWGVLFLSFCFSGLLEVLQLFPWAAGTFDVFDIAAEWAAEFFAVIMAVKGEKIYEEK